MSRNDADSLWFPAQVFSNVETLADYKPSDIPYRWRVVPNKDFQHTKVNKVCVKKLLHMYKAVCVCMHYKELSYPEILVYCIIC